MSISASSTLCSRRLYRSITADSNSAPFSFGTLSVIVPAFTVRFRS